MWTIFTTKESPPEDLEEFRRANAEHSGLGHNLREIVAAIRAMPVTMQRLFMLQIGTWHRLFCMWLCFPPAV